MNEQQSNHQDTMAIAIITISSAALAVTFLLIDLLGLIPDNYDLLPSGREWIGAVAAAVGAAILAGMIIYAKHEIFKVPAPRQDPGEDGTEDTPEHESKQKANARLFAMTAFMATIPILILIATLFAGMNTDPTATDNTDTGNKTHQEEKCQEWQKPTEDYP